MITIQVTPNLSATIPNHGERNVSASGDRREPLGPFHGAGSFEGYAGGRDAMLRPRDSLFHRALGHEEGARDLFHGQARDDPERKRDLLGRREIGMAADKQESQYVIAVVRAIESFRERGLGIVDVG